MVHKITGHRATIVVLGAVEPVVLSPWGRRQQTSETSHLGLREMRCSADSACFLRAGPGVGTIYALGPRTVAFTPVPCRPLPMPRDTHPTAVPPGNSYFPPQLRVSPHIFLLCTRAVTGAGARLSASGQLLSPVCDRRGGEGRGAEVSDSWLSERLLSLASAQRRAVGVPGPLRSACTSDLLTLGLLRSVSQGSEVNICTLFF